MTLVDAETDVFADGVVVWRMRVLCAARFSKKVMIIPSIMLGLTAGTSRPIPCSSHLHLHTLNTGEHTLVE